MSVSMDLLNKDNIGGDERYDVIVSFPYGLTNTDMITRQIQTILDNAAKSGLVPLNYASLAEKYQGPLPAEETDIERAWMEYALMKSAEGVIHLHQTRFSFPDKETAERFRHNILQDRPGEYKTSFVSEKPQEDCALCIAYCATVGIIGADVNTHDSGVIATFSYKGDRDSLDLFVQEILPGLPAEVRDYALSEGIFPEDMREQLFACKRGTLAPAGHSNPANKALPPLKLNAA